MNNETPAPEAPSSKQVAKLEAQLALKDRIIAALKNDAISTRAQLEKLTERVTVALGGDSDMRAQLKIEMMGYAVLDMVGAMLEADDWIVKAIGVIEDQGTRIESLTRPAVDVKAIDRLHRLSNLANDLPPEKVHLIDVEKVKKARRHVKAKSTTSRKARRAKKGRA